MKAYKKISQLVVMILWTLFAAVQAAVPQELAELAPQTLIDTYRQHDIHRSEELNTFNCIQSIMAAANPLHGERSQSNPIKPFCFITPEAASSIASLCSHSNHITKSKAALMEQIDAKQAERIEKLKPLFKLVKENNFDQKKIQEEQEKTKELADILTPEISAQINELQKQLQQEPPSSSFFTTNTMPGTVQLLELLSYHPTALSGLEHHRNINKMTNFFTSHKELRIVFDKFLHETGTDIDALFGNSLIQQWMDINLNDKHESRFGKKFMLGLAVWVAVWAIKFAISPMRTVIGILPLHYAFLPVTWLINLVAHKIFKTAKISNDWAKIAIHIALGMAIGGPLSNQIITHVPYVGDAFSAVTSFFSSYGIPHYDVFNFLYVDFPEFSINGSDSFWLKYTWDFFKYAGLGLNYTARGIWNIGTFLAQVVSPIKLTLEEASASNTIKEAFFFEKTLTEQINKLFQPLRTAIAKFNTHIDTVYGKNIAIIPQIPLLGCDKKSIETVSTILNTISDLDVSITLANLKISSQKGLKDVHYNQIVTKDAYNQLLDKFTRGAPRVTLDCEPTTTIEEKLETIKQIATYTNDTQDLTITTIPISNHVGIAVKNMEAQSDGAIRRLLANIVFSQSLGFVFAPMLQKNSPEPQISLLGRFNIITVNKENTSLIDAVALDFVTTPAVA